MAFVWSRIRSAARLGSLQNVTGSMVLGHCQLLYTSAASATTVTVQIRSAARLCSLQNVTGSMVLGHWQLFCTSATTATASLSKFATSTASVKEKYFTPDSIDGAEMDSTKGSILEDLFNRNRSLCFDNIKSTIGCHDFSPFSKSIFAKIMTVSYRQGDERNRYFRFDPSSILIRHLNNKVLEVGIPTSQLIEEDEVDKSVYQDHIVGPVANLVLSLALKSVNVDPKSGALKMEQCYKEALDLLHRAQIGEWWCNLDEILAHPLFQLLEEKIVYLALAHMWLNGPKCAPPHGVSPLPPERTRTKLTPGKFQDAYSNNAFYLKDYSISNIGSEMVVAESSNQQDWKAYFKSKGCFGKNYYFGPGVNEYADMVRQCRAIIFHFEDKNMNAYAAVLDKPSVKVAMIHLDRTFSLSLSFFHTLRELGIKVENVLDVVPF